MTTQAEQRTLHGGRLVARRLKAHGVTKLFTLSGGHLFSIYDGCRTEGIELVDVRHEASAAFAAEGWAKVTREPGVCAVTAGPGVTNAMSAIASAQQNHSPMIVLGGRAPAFRWGQGSLQEIDHVPFVAPLVKSAATPSETGDIPAQIDRAFSSALEPHSGPAFVDFPLDVVFMESEELDFSPASEGGSSVPSDSELDSVCRMLAAAERPVVMAGSDLYWGRAEGELVAFVERLRIPTFVNGLARGCVPADHDLYFSRTRGSALKDADLVLLVGVPMDFRLGFGASFAETAKVVVIDRAAPKNPYPRSVDAELYGELPLILTALGEGSGGSDSDGGGWVTGLREQETAKRASQRAEFDDPRAPLHPLRIYGELINMLDRDAVIVGDGGDFVSYAGRFIDSYEPGCWLDPGPFGCLGCGPGYALAAKLAHPERQVVLLCGDGAFGFSGMEFDTFARHGVNVVAVMGNNGIWGLEKHPMEFVYGYSVVADLTPETRYDKVVEALGGHGEFVERPDQLRGALERAFAADKPALVNVLTDPAVAYPRTANLA